MKKLLIFASGSGTNAENIIKYFQKTKTAQIVAVFTNNPKAKVIERATNLNVSTIVFNKKSMLPESSFKKSDLFDKITQINPDLIILAGFLWKFPEEIIASYNNKIINIHPALLPKYGGKGMYGMHVHEAVVKNKETETGITVHYVNKNYDEGAIIFQKSFEINHPFTALQVAEKIHEIEQKYFPFVIENLLKEKL